MEFIKVPYFKRVWNSYRLRGVTFVEFFVVIVIIYSFFIPYLLLALLPIIVPLLFDSYIYVYRIYTQDENLYIYYLAFNKEKSIIVPNKNLRIVEYELGLNTGPMFKIVEDFGKGNIKRIVRQYKIVEWSKKENVEMLKKMLK